MNRFDYVRAGDESGAGLARFELQGLGDAAGAGELEIDHGRAPCWPMGCWPMAC